MKSRYVTFLFAILLSVSAISQVQQTGNPENSLKGSQPDTNGVKLLLKLAEPYYFTKPDSCLVFAKQAAELAHQLKFIKGELIALNMAGEAFRFLGDFPQALEMQFKALQINRMNRDKKGEAGTLTFIGFTYVELNECRQGLNYLYQAKEIFNTIQEPIRATFNLSNIGHAYEIMNMLDSALFFQQQAHTNSLQLTHGNLKVLILTRLGIVYARMGNHQQALQHYQNALQNATLIGDKVNPAGILHRIAESNLALNNKDSAFYYARRSFAEGQNIFQKLQILDASNLLVKLFRSNNKPDSVIYYQDIAIAINDSLFGPGKLRQLQLLALNEQERQQEILQEAVSQKNRTRMLALLATLGVFLIIGIILFRNNRHKQKVNVLLRDQKNEIQETLTELRSTQAQLVQREKMASLGELTAGIAHEIQNPLNFVNNFSEVNTELIAEMQQEMDKGNLSDAKAIAKDIKDNEEKINHHGKRADAIVKGMLQHSRSSSGLKEPTDINALADEYLRLAYHGLRAKDKMFNASIKTDFDETIGKINIIPQDIGRAILNMISNAFYAVTEKKKQQGVDFEPTVTVGTRRINGKVEIKVKDNGNGIPSNALDKIFQPFFTTKPTGQGTGLGLSLSYDIIKAHAGQIKVDTREGVGTEFIVSLSIGHE